MFNRLSINTAEVNAGIRAPGTPVLSIVPAEDTNALSWTSPYFTDFFVLYWSDNAFTSVSEPGVHEVTVGMPIPGEPPLTEVSYTHDIPAAFSLSVIYYRVAARNRYGSTLSNQVNNYNFRLAIYEDVYKKTLDELTLRFTPEIRRQYEDSILWRSFVQSLASELAQSRFEIKEALKQLNLQKAVDVFLNMWNDVTGISRVNIEDSAGIPVPETDSEYRQRLVDNIFWDKISNLALKKTMLLRLGYDGDVLDAGVDGSIFRNVPLATTLRYRATHDSIFIPGEIVAFLFWGPNGQATVVSDTGDSDSAGTLTYSGRSGPGGTPYSYFGQTSQMFANPSGAPSGSPSGTAAHTAILNPFEEGSSPSLYSLPGDLLTFSISGAQATFVSNIGGVLTFDMISGSPIPVQYDIVSNPRNVKYLLTSAGTKVTSEGEHPVNSKLLSNIYSVNLGIASLPDLQLNELYDEISALGSLGNVLTKILQDISTAFEDWDTDLGSIPYGAIFMGAGTYADVTKSTEVDWAIAEELYMDNQWDMSDAKTFYGNNGPDDIVILTRII